MTSHFKIAISGAAGLETFRHPVRSGIVLEP
jgi:hypothetical protein